MKYLLGLEIGTTAFKAVVLSKALHPLKRAKNGCALITKGDFVEFSAEKYWKMGRETLDEMRAEYYDIYAYSIDSNAKRLSSRTKRETRLTTPSSD